MVRTGSLGGARCAVGARAKGRDRLGVGGAGAGAEGDAQRAGR